MSSSQRLLLAALAASTLFLTACGDDPAQTPARDTAAVASPSQQPDPSLDDTSHAGTSSQSPAPGGTAASPRPWPSSDAGLPAAESERTAVVGTLDGFFETIETGNEPAFRSQLSTRSVELLRSLHAEDEIWPIAREALGTLDGRRLSILGGDADSVALLVSATRREADSVVREDLILSLLRESGAWKVMYPGAQRLDEHVGP